MAPEILQKQIYEGDKADVFACSVTLFKLICGSNPFLSAEPDDKLYKLIMNKDFDEFWEQHGKIRM